MKSLDIRVMGPQDVSRAVSWAASEGWNPGAQDADCFACVDPDGFWGGWIGNEMVSAISVVNYDARFSFLGFYMTAPHWRGQGYGYRLWQAALAHAGARVVGLDGVVAEQDNYRRSGFEPAWRNIRFGGVPSRRVAPGPVQILPLKAPDTRIEALDLSVFPSRRSGFWAKWFSAEGHHAIRAVRDGETEGFATLRPCVQGYKIGPLVATSRGIAEATLDTLLEVAGPGAELFWDIPETNTDAVALAEERGLQPVFETARMYKGPAPDLKLDRLFGVTSFELG